MHGEEKTDPICRLKTRHNGVMWSRLSEKAASFGSILCKSVLKHIRSEKQHEIDSDYISFVIKEGFTVRRMFSESKYFCFAICNAIALKTHSDVQKFSSHAIVSPGRMMDNQNS